MLVPSSRPQVPWLAGSDERMPTPGADTSGFSSSEMGVGPPDEKPAMVSLEVTAATAIASGAFAGDVIVP
jgi:hypothetical protein